MTKEAILERIVEIMKERSRSEREFAKLIGVNQKTINQQIKQDRSLSLDTILSIVRTFEDISVEWLLTGKGGMLKQVSYLSSSNQGDGNSIEYNNVGIGNNVNASLVDSKNLKEISPAGKIEMSASDPIDLPPSDSEMAFLKAEIAHLKENIEIKDELIISLKETIALLKNKQN